MENAKRKSLSVMVTVCGSLQISANILNAISISTQYEGIGDEDQTHGRGFFFQISLDFSVWYTVLCLPSVPFSPLLLCITLENSIFSSHVPDRTKWALPSLSVTTPVTCRSTAALRLTLSR